MFFKYACPFFPGTSSQNELLRPMRPPAAFSNMELEGRSPSKMQGGSWETQPTPRCLTHPIILYYSISRYTGSQNGWYFQKSRLCQNGWSFNISRKGGYIRMAGPSVFPDTRVIPKRLDFQYFQIHGSLNLLEFQYFQIPRSLK